MLFVIILSVATACAWLSVMLERKQKRFSSAPGIVIAISTAGFSCLGSLTWVLSRACCHVAYSDGTVRMVFLLFGWVVTVLVLRGGRLDI